MKVGTLLTTNAIRYPDKVALICGKTRLTFKELEIRANRLAHGLIQRGIRHGDRVAVYLPNSAELVWIVCAVLKAGAIVVPISTRLAEPEIEYIFKHAQPAAVVFAPSGRDAALLAAAELLETLLIVTGSPGRGELGHDDLLESGSPEPLPPLPLEPDDAVIAYTSGTTGRPKGAISTHANLIIGQGLMTAMEWGLRHDDVIMTTTPMAHRIGIARICNALCMGATHVVLPAFRPADAVAVMERERVSVVSLVPTIVRMLLTEIEKEPQRCATLRAIVATGEAFPASAKAQLMALLPGLQIHSFYSQTEAGLVSSLRPEAQLTHPLSVGHVVPGVEVRIVDHDLSDVPPGHCGEILVRCGRPGQASVMRAYYNAPAATAAAFIEGWLRTGDVGRFDDEGYLYFVDRAKDMIVSGGLNIYSKEVEIVLASHPAVAEVAVVGVADDMFGEAVMAFVELAADASVSAQELVEHCRTVIASYKKPKYIRFVQSFPRSSTGKILKGELRLLAKGGCKPETKP